MKIITESAYQGMEVARNVGLFFVALCPSIYKSMRCVTAPQGDAPGILFSLLEFH